MRNDTMPPSSLQNAYPSVVRSRQNRVRQAGSRWVVSLLFASAFPLCVFAQDSFTLTVNPTYSVMTSGTAIPLDFAGIGFETQSVVAGQFGVTGNFFSSSNTGLVTLFQNLSLRNIRVGGGTVDGCQRSTPSTSDIAALFGFAASANLKVIYSLPLENPQSCANSSLAANDGSTANTIMTSYAANLHSFSLGNEVDWHSYHSFCDTSSANCTCTNGSGCSVSGTGVDTINDPLMYETFNPCSNTSGSTCTLISGDSYEPGTGYTSYLSDWTNYASTVTSSVTSGTPKFSGPDTGDYSGGTNFTGSVSACSGDNFTDATWTQMLYTCEEALNPSQFALPTQHLYVGGGLGYLNANEALENMLSAVWVTETTPSYEPFGTTSPCRTYPEPSGDNCPSGYSPYPYMKSMIPAGTRLTESNDFLGGSNGASNAFGSALWALDYMQWWAANGATGVNFHNNPWLYTDTVVPSNVEWSSNETLCNGTCSSTYELNPKGYGMKAFDLGGHGYSIAVSPQTDAGYIDSYAVGSGQDLYVTIVNRTNTIYGNEETADVTIDLTTGSGASLPFAAASVASIALTDVTGGGAGVVTTQDWTSTTVGGSNITDSGPWYGEWTPLSAFTGSGYSVTVPASTATVYHFRAPSYYAGPIQINQTGTLEMFATKSNVVYHNYQQASTEPASAPSNWNASGSTAWPSLTGVTPTGPPAVVKNHDNTLEIFVPTSGDVYHNWQVAPAGGWNGWVDMGSGSSGLTDIQVGQGAGGELSVFGINSSGGLYYSSETGPRAGWSTWAELGGSLSGGVKPGYVVTQNLSGRVEVFAADGSAGPQIWHTWQTISGPYTTSWSVLTTAGATVSSPQLAVARNLSGTLEVFGIGTDGKVWHSSQASAGAGPWSTWSELESGTQIAIQPGFAVGQNDSGDLVVYGVSGTGSSAQVYYNAQSSPGGSYSSTWTEIAMPSGDYAGSDQIVVSSTADGRMQIFTTGNNGDVWTNWQTAAGGSGSWNGWTDFGSGSSGLSF